MIECLIPNKLSLICSCQLDQSYRLVIFLQALYLGDLDHTAAQAKSNNIVTIHQGVTK
jgi:hypothetical protein